MSGGARTRRAAAAALLALAAGACDAHPLPPRQPGVEDIALDWSVNPCDDFYQFACGNWARWHPIADVNARATRVSNVQDQQVAALYRIVYDDTYRLANSHHPDDVYAAKIGDYYQSCYFAAGQQMPFASALQDQLTAISGARSVSDLAGVLARLHMDGVEAGFAIWFDRDPGQPARQIVHLGDGGIAMDPGYYLDASLASYLAAYRAHIGDLTSAVSDAVGIPPGTATADAVLRVETALAAASLSRVDARDPYATYNLTSINALPGLAPRFDWNAYFAAGRIPSPSEVNLADPAFIVAFDRMLALTSLADLQAYLSWRAIEAAAPALGSAVAPAEFQFHDRLFAGRTSPLPDYWRCFIATVSGLGFAVARPFVAERFAGSQRDAAAQLLESIRLAMGDTIASRAWLDEPTRAAAAAKLAAVIPKIGFPDVWPSFDALDVRRDFGAYLGNRIELSRFYWNRAVATLDVPADRGEWLMAPWITNAYYSPERNDIVFPAGILQPPFFDQQRPAAANYGAIGSVMGHELTHGFDDQGRRYDGDGRLTDWWTPDVAAEFTRRSACLVDQYRAFEPLPGIHIDGALTLGENLADLGGLKLAYAAFHAPNGGAGAGAPGFFTPDQQFFIAFAQSWCENDRPAYEADNLRTDPHSPSRYRVNGTVANVPEFATAFRCDAGAPLAPANRCDVW